MDDEKASITLFLAMLFLTLIIVFSTLIESARVRIAVAEVEMNCYNAQRSLAAHYDKKLWEDYDIFGLNLKRDINNVFSNYVNLTTNVKRNGFFNVNLSNVNIIPNTYTEDGGKEFARQAVICMKYRMPAKLIDKIKGGDVENNTPSISGEIDDATEEEMKKYKDHKKEDPRVETDKLKDDDNFVKFGIGSRDVSSKVLDKKINLEGKLKKVSFTDEIFLNEYVLSHFTNAVTADKSSDKALDYEVEYILKGKTKDKDNLKKVCTDIKIIRFPINYNYILNKTSYRLAVKIAALVISGWTLNSAAVKATEYSLISAWALAESAIDLKTLLAGGRVPVFKDENSWNLGWTQLLAFWKVKPKDSKKGMNYDDYLRYFLALKNNSSKVKNSMNIIEANTGKEFSKTAYKFNTHLKYKVDKKFLTPILMGSKIYTKEFVAAYGYR